MDLEFSLPPFTIYRPDWVRASAVDAGLPDLLSARETPMRHLSALEMATVRPNFGPDRAYDEGASVGRRAAFSLHQWRARGFLADWSGWRVAQEMQALFVKYCPHPRNPMMGWDALRLVDAESAEHGVEIWCAAPPLEDRPNSYRVVRLTARLRELGWNR